MGEQSNEKEQDYNHCALYNICYLYLSFQNIYFHDPHIKTHNNIKIYWFREHLEFLFYITTFISWWSRNVLQCNILF